MVLIFVGGCKKIFFKVVFPDMWTLNETQNLVSINKVLLEHSHIHVCGIVHGCFHTTMAELSSCERPFGLRSLKCLSGPLWKKFSNPCVILLMTYVFKTQKEDMFR